MRNSAAHRERQHGKIRLRPIIVRVFPNKQIAQTHQHISFASWYTGHTVHSVFHFLSTYYRVQTTHGHAVYKLAGVVFFGQNSFCSVSFCEHVIRCLASYHLIRLSHFGSWHSIHSVLFHSVRRFCGCLLSFFATWIKCAIASHRLRVQWPICRFVISKYKFHSLHLYMCFRFRQFRGQ